MKLFSRIMQELHAEAMNQSERDKIPKEEFVYPEGYDDNKEPAFPIHDEAHGKAALAYAHNAPDPEFVKNAVYKKYPNLKKDNKTQASKPATNTNSTTTKTGNTNDKK